MNIDTQPAAANDAASMPDLPTPISLDERVREFEAGLIRWALDATHGNKSRAAILLGIKRSTLGDRIARCGLSSRPPIQHNVK